MMFLDTDAYGQQGHHSAIRAAVNLNLFERLADNDGKSTSSSELATSTGADSVLLGEYMTWSICRVVRADGLFSRAFVEASSSNGHYLRNRS